MVELKVGAKDAGLLARNGVNAVFHYAPVHYLVFVTRAKALLSKDELIRRGFTRSHFRRTSQRTDRERGFSKYVHLTVNAFPKILRAKLKAGFPHFEFRIPAGYIDTTSFHLCRYNIAKSRNPKLGKSPAPEGPATGYYQSGKLIPTAETLEECESLLKANLGTNMIEVLIPDELRLPNETELIFFSESDIELARDLLREMNVAWRVGVAAGYTYTAASFYRTKVEQFLERARQRPEWKGDGLDFDRL
jgi:hypothetical protein